MMRQEPRTNQQSVLSYANADVPQWVTLQYFATPEEAAADAAELALERIEYDLVESSQPLRRPDGTLAPYQLRVRAADEPRACTCLSLVPDDLGTAEIAATDAGDGPIELLDVDGVSRRWMPVARYTHAQQLLDVSAALGAAGIEALLPRLVPGDSPLAAPITRPDRFVLYIAEDQLDDARDALAADDVPQDPDEPRCPRCRSWCVGSAPKTNGMLHWLIGSVFRDEAKLQCSRCGHIDQRERFILHPAGDIALAKVVRERKPRHV